jgi:hypothetical protein
MKIRLVRAQLFHACWQRDGQANGQAEHRDEASGSFSQFYESF